MDSFDDFELKPLSKGLGFHKEPVNLSDSLKKTGLDKVHLKKTVPKRPPQSFLNPTLGSSGETTYEDLLASLSTPKKSSAFSDLFEEDRLDSTSQMDSPEETSVSLSKTLPRQGSRSTKSAMSLNTELVNNDPLGTDIFPNTPQRKPSIAPEIPTPVKPLRDEVDKQNIKVRSDIFNSNKKSKEGVRRGSHDSPPVGHLTKAPICVRSIFLDVLVVLAMSLVFLLSLLMITKVDLMNVWNTSKYDLMTQLSMGVLYITVYQMYVVISRSFFGRTLGEWTFDFQLGDDKQQKRALYPLIVLWRSLVIVVTGVVTLPLLSFLFRVDLASYLSGLQLYEQK